MKAMVALSVFLSALASTAWARPNPDGELRLARKERVWLGSPMSTGLDIAFVMTQFGKFGDEGGAFKDAPVKGGRIALEWIPFGEAMFGKLGFGVAAGYLASEPRTVGGASRQVAFVPTELYVAYRADFFHQQLFVPFGKVGTNFTFYKNAANNWYVYPGLDVAVGLELCLSHLEPTVARQLDSNFGINDAYVLVEAVRSDFLGSYRGPDLRNDGIRIALRFEM